MEWTFYSSSKYESQFLNKYNKLQDSQQNRHYETNRDHTDCTAFLPYLKATWNKSDYIHAGGSFRSST